MRDRLDLPSDALAVVQAECYAARPLSGTPEAVAVLDRLGTEQDLARRRGPSSA